MGIPNIHSLYRRASTNLTTFFNAVNSLPNVLVSTVFFRLLNAMIRYLLTKTSTPVCDLRVTLLPVWLASTKQCVDTELPRGLGIFVGIASFKPLYKSCHSNLWNQLMSIFGWPGSNPSLRFELSLRYPKIWKSCYKCPIHGEAR